MTRHIVLLCLLVLLGCQQDSSLISPRTCGNPCSTNTDCSDFFSGCRVCFRGRCASSLPATPVAIDAGVDTMP